MSTIASPSADRPLRVAVVGHTNTGKTSLMRTLLRDEGFGEVADRPAVTTGVDAAVLTADDRDVLELLDTPGLEDSVGLLEILEDAAASGEDGVDTLRRVLAGPSCGPGARFGQEAMSLRQVLESGAALYVIDARETVRAKHRDELTILGMSARPIVPVLNFTAGPEAQAGAWREQLRRVGMHAVASFDTVVFDAGGERQLFEKLRSLLHDDAPALDALIDARSRERERLIRVAGRLVAELLVDVAATSAPVETTSEATGSAGHGDASVEAFRETIRIREAACTRRMLELFRFDAARLHVAELDIVGGRWGLDLFSPEAMRRWGTTTGSTAALGAGIGLGLDAAVGGLSGGAGALTGAAIGGLVGFSRTHGRRLVNRLRGRTELRADDATLQRLAARQMDLARVLLRRGHAAMGPIAGSGEAPSGPPLTGPLLRRLATARARPEWSSIEAAAGPAGAGGTEAREGAAAGSAGRPGVAATRLEGGAFVPDPGRDELIRHLAEALAAGLAAGLAGDAAAADPPPPDG